MRQDSGFSKFSPFTAVKMNDSKNAANIPKKYVTDFSLLTLRRQATYFTTKPPYTYFSENIFQTENVSFM